MKVCLRTGWILRPWRQATSPFASTSRRTTEVLSIFIISTAIWIPKRRSHQRQPTFATSPESLESPPQKKNLLTQGFCPAFPLCANSCLNIFSLAAISFSLGSPHARCVFFATGLKTFCNRIDALFSQLCRHESSEFFAL